MRRNAIRFFALGMSILALAGCKSGEKQTSVDPMYDTDMYAATTPTTNYSTTPSYPSYDTPTVTTTSFESTGMDSGTIGSRVHTVIKGDTLYGLARSYYGDHRRWKDIYEANRALIGSNPNQIRVGQKLTIP